jgi:hypothetical protein
VAKDIAFLAHNAELVYASSGTPLGGKTHQGGTSFD